MVSLCRSMRNTKIYSEHRSTLDLLLVEARSSTSACPACQNGRSPLCPVEKRNKHFVKWLDFLSDIFPSDQHLAPSFLLSVLHFLLHEADYDCEKVELAAMYLDNLYISNIKFKPPQSLAEKSLQVEHQFGELSLIIATSQSALGNCLRLYFCFSPNYYMMNHLNTHEKKMRPYVM